MMTAWSWAPDTTDTQRGPPWLPRSHRGVVSERTEAHAPVGARAWPPGVLLPSRRSGRSPNGANTFHPSVLASEARCARSPTARGPSVSTRDGEPSRQGRIVDRDRRDNDDAGSTHVGAVSRHNLTTPVTQPVSNSVRIGHHAESGSEPCRMTSNVRAHDSLFKLFPLLFRRLTGRAGATPMPGLPVPWRGPVKSKASRPEVELGAG